MPADTIPFIACAGCKRRRVPFPGQRCAICRARLCGRELEAAGLEEREREQAAKETPDAR